MLQDQLCVKQQEYSTLLRKRQTLTELVKEHSTNLKKLVRREEAIRVKDEQNLAEAKGIVLHFKGLLEKQEEQLGRLNIRGRGRGR